MSILEIIKKDVEIDFSDIIDEIKIKKSIFIKTSINDNNIKFTRIFDREI